MQSVASRNKDIDAIDLFMTESVGAPKYGIILKGTSSLEKNKNVIEILLPLHQGVHAFDKALILVVGILIKHCSH